MERFHETAIQRIRREQAEKQEIKRQQEQERMERRLDMIFDVLAFVILFILIVLFVLNIPEALDRWYYKEYEKPVEELYYKK